MSEVNPYEASVAADAGNIEGLGQDGGGGFLDRKSFFVREHVGVLKLSNTYDILDPASQKPLGIAKERPGALIHLMRFLVNKRLLPTKLHIYEGSDFEDESKLLFSLNKGFALFRPKLEVCDTNGRVVGWLKSKMFSLGGAFRVFDADGREVALVQGDWKGWNFRFLDSSQNEIGTVTKKWAGMGKELFTSADNYIISLNDSASVTDTALLLVAGLAIDTVLKE